MSHGFDFATQNLSESVRFIPAPSYLTEGGLVKIRKLLDEVSVPVDLDLSQATGLTYIAPGAFIDCIFLNSVKLPSSVTEIGKFAFESTNLTEVTIPAGVTTIRVGALFYCAKLTKVTFQKTDGWCTKTDLYNEDELPAPIDVSKPEDNATNLKDSAGLWYGKYLIR